MGRRERIGDKHFVAERQARGPRWIRPCEGRPLFRRRKAPAHLRCEHVLRCKFSRQSHGPEGRCTHGEIWHQLRALSPHGHAQRARRHLRKGRPHARPRPARQARFFHRRAEEERHLRRPEPARLPHLPRPSARREKGQPRLRQGRGQLLRRDDRPTKGLRPRPPHARERLHRQALRRRTRRRARGDQQRKRPRLPVVGRADGRPPQPVSRGAGVAVGRMDFEKARQRRSCAQGVERRRARTGRGDACRSLVELRAARRRIAVAFGRERPHHAYRQEPRHRIVARAVLHFSTRCEGWQLRGAFPLARQRERCGHQGCKPLRRTHAVTRAVESPRLRERKIPRPLSRSFRDHPNHRSRRQGPPHHRRHG